MPQYYEHLYYCETQKIRGNHSVEKVVVGNQEYLLWYLYNTLICRACITTKEFELCNGGWETVTTSRALSALYKFYIEKNYRLSNVGYGGDSYIPRVLRGYVAAERRGYKMANTQQKIPCIHMGKYKPINRMGENDTIIIHPDKIKNIVSIRPYVQMKGTTLNEIIRSTNAGEFPFDVEITYSTAAPDYCYASWMYKDVHYLFRLRLQSTKWNTFFTEQLAVYVATDIFKVDEDSHAMMLFLDMDKVSADMIIPRMQYFKEL